MQKKQKLLQFVTAIVFALALVSIPLAAQAAAVDIPCKPSESGTGDLFTCVNQLYKYALVICSIAAIIMIMIGGYMYIFSGGSEKKVGTAKSFIQSSLVGIAVLLVGFVLLRQINPSLLTIKSITPSQVGFQQWLVNGQIVTTNNPPAGSILLSNGKDIRDCPGGIKPIPLNLTGGRTGESGCQTLIDALQKVKDEATKLGVDFSLTDAYGPGKHVDPCHTVAGTCADLVPKTNDSNTWNKLCQAVANTGQFRILNEYDDSVVPACGKYTHTSMTSGDHIHIVLQGAISTLGSETITSANWPTGQVQGNGVVCKGGSADRANETVNCTAYATEIKAAANEFGIDQNLIRAVIHIESKFVNGQTSSANAQGLMQITPDTAKGCNSAWATDPKENIRCGTRYLKTLLAQFSGNVQAALARYNSTEQGDANGASNDCPGLAKWQCSFDNAQHTVCNTRFVKTRNYILNYQALSTKYQNSCK